MSRRVRVTVVAGAAGLVIAVGIFAIVASADEVQASVSGPPPSTLPHAIAAPFRALPDSGSASPELAEQLREFEDAKSRLDDASSALTPSAAAEMVRGMPRVFRRIDRVKVKRTSLRAYESVVGESVASGDSERAVLLVAVAGKVVPAFGRGTTYRWGVLVVDEVTGEPLSLRAGPERWPPFFSGVS